jgi:hypothetical protein
MSDPIEVLHETGRRMDRTRWLRPPDRRVIVAKRVAFLVLLPLGLILLIVATYAFWLGIGVFV